MLGKKLFPKRHDAEAPAIKCSAAARVSCDTLTDTLARRGLPCHTCQSHAWLREAWSLPPDGSDPA